MDLLLQAPILDSDRLPPLPADPRNMGRHVSWVVCCQSPDFHYKANHITVDAAWIDARVTAYLAHNESKPGWIPPIQLGHTDTGERQGDFFQLQRATVGNVTAKGLDWSDPRETMLAAVAWADPLAAQKIADKIITHVSIGIAAGVQRPDTGEVLKGVPIEITKTAIPHFGEAAILNEAVMPDLIPPEADEKKKDEEEVAAVDVEAPAAADPMEVVMTMLERILKMISPQVEAAPVAATPVEARNVELEARLVELETRAKNAERQARRVAFDAKCPEGGSLSLTAAIKDMVFEFSEANPDAATSIMAAYTGAPVEVKATAPVVVSRDNPWAPTVGQGHANAPEPAGSGETFTMAELDIAATVDGVVDHAMALKLERQAYAAGKTLQKED